MRARVHFNIFLLFLLPSCSPEEVDLDVPIVFAPITRDVMETTRAGGNGLERDFVVCGYKTIPLGQQYVIPKYGVAYSSGTYNYVKAGQPQVYWDSKASEYRFWGFTAGNGIESTGDGTTIDISVSLQTGLSVSQPLYSALKLITEIDYKTVELEFLHPVSRLSVMFYSEQPLTDGQELNISDIALAPKEDSQAGKVSKIWTAGIVTVSYPLNGGTQETVSVQQRDPAAVSDNLPFEDVTLAKDAGDKISNAVFAKVPDAVSCYYYSLPMGNKNPEFILSMKLDGEDRTASIPEHYMCWEANHSYNYFFKVSGADKKVELYDVQVDAWHYGGDQNEEWNNWW